VSTLERIVIVIEPRDAGLLGNGQPNSSQRTFFEYDRFAKELRQATDARVEIAETPLVEAQEDAMLIVAYHIAMRDTLPAAVARLRPSDPRPLVVNTNYEDAFLLAETMRPAAIVPSERFARWRLLQEDRIRRQIYGLKALADPLAPELYTEPLGGTPDYVLFSSREVLTLPSVLARYLRSYWQRVSGGSS
jgi:hypothetical protein